MQADLDKELAKADAEIAARASETEAEIAALRDAKTEQVTEIALEATPAILAALGGKADAAAVKAAIAAQLKG